MLIKNIGLLQTENKSNKFTYKNNVGEFELKEQSDTFMQKQQ